MFPSFFPKDHRLVFFDESTRTWVWMARGSLPTRALQEMDMGEALKEWNTVQATLRQVSTKLSLGRVLLDAFAMLFGGFHVCLSFGFVFGSCFCRCFRSSDPVANWVIGRFCGLFPGPGRGFHKKP